MRRSVRFATVIFVFSAHLSAGMANAYMSPKRLSQETDVANEFKDSLATLKACGQKSLSDDYYSLMIKYWKFCEATERQIEKLMEDYAKGKPENCDRAYIAKSKVESYMATLKSLVSLKTTYRQGCDD